MEHYKEIKRLLLYSHFIDKNSAFNVNIFPRDLFKCILEEIKEYYANLDVNLDLIYKIFLLNEKFGNKLDKNIISIKKNIISLKNLNNNHIFLKNNAQLINDLNDNFKNINSLPPYVINIALKNGMNINRIKIFNQKINMLLGNYDDYKSLNYRKEIPNELIPYVLFYYPQQLLNKNYNFDPKYIKKTLDILFQQDFVNLKKISGFISKLQKNHINDEIIKNYIVGYYIPYFEYIKNPNIFLDNNNHKYKNIRSIIQSSENHSGQSLGKLDDMTLTNKWTNNQIIDFLADCLKSDSSIFETCFWKTIYNKISKDITDLDTLNILQSISIEQTIDFFT